MRRLDMNFVPVSRWRLLPMLLLIAGLLGSLHALLLRDDLLEQQETQRDVIRKLERTASRHQQHAASAQRQDPKAVAEVHRLAMELQRPWEDMLNALQAAARPDMLITRLQPGAGAGQLMVSGQADNSQAFLDYVSRLRQNPAWASVQPVSEERAGASSGVAAGKPLVFQLQAEWGAP